MAVMRRLLALVLMIAAGVALAGVVAQRSARVPEPAPARATGPTASAVFAGGCFWSTESAFEHMPGVISATSGFSGGRAANPTYSDVSGGGTGYLESVRVVYDPSQISYASLVARFLRTIDPTDPDGQFCDRGDQYRTAIFVANAAERRAAEAAKAEAARQLRAPVVTEVRPAAAFHAAEDYHQDFARRNPTRYGMYRRGCGRDARLQQVWSRAG
jgi:peptide-methionine (S)-S-oxide reductase